MKKQMWLPLESDDLEQRRRVWSQIPERDRTDFIVRCAALIARAARVVETPQEEEERREAIDR